LVSLPRRPVLTAAAAILCLLVGVVTGAGDARADTSSGCAAPAAGTITCGAVVTPGVTGVAALATTATPPGLGPSAIQDAYGLQSASAGMRQTVAVVTAYDDPKAESDLATYRSQYSVPPCTTADGCFRKVDENGGTSYPAAGAAGWTAAIAESLDMISAACPNCHIIVVEAAPNGISDLGQAENEAVSLGAKFVTNTWFTPEASYGTSEPGYDASYFNHPGVAITAPDGNGGGYGTYYPAASPDVIAVGGTTLTAASGTTRGWTETAWSDSGSGCSPYEAKPSWQADTGCSTRMLNDVSALADASPSASPVAFYNTDNSGWTTGGGTAVASAIIAAGYALAGTPAAGSYPASYLYASTPLINDVTNGSNGTCSPGPAYFCGAGSGYDGPAGVGTPASVIPFTSGGISPLGQVHSGIAGKCMDNWKGSQTSPNKVDIFTCNTGTFPQKWTVRADGTIRIAGGALCLDNSGNTNANGNPVQAYTCIGSPAQQWRLRYPNEIVNPATGRCLDDHNSSTTDGTQLVIWQCNAGLNQQWALPYPVPASTGEVTSGLSTSSASYCLDNLKGGTANGNTIDIWTCNGGSGSQEWTIEPDNTIQIRGMCLDNANGGTADGNTIQLYTCNGSDPQQWIARSDGSLYNPSTGKCLDDPHSVTTNGTKLDLWTCNQTPAQAWHLPS
jgi:hypothetical protein